MLARGGLQCCLFWKWMENCAWQKNRSGSWRLEEIESRVRYWWPSATHSVVGKAACTVASLLWWRCREHGETRARIASCPTKVWRRCRVSGNRCTWSLSNWFPWETETDYRNVFAANVRGTKTTPMDVGVFVKSKGGKKNGEGKDKESETKKFYGNCFWCGAHGHAMKDWSEKANGKPKTAQSLRMCDRSKEANSRA